MKDIEVIVSLQIMFGSARDQGQRPTCLAFAASDAHAAIRDGWVPLSCEYAFYHAQRRANSSSEAGATLTTMLAALKFDGQPEESGWIYSSVNPPNDGAWAPPAQISEIFHCDGQVCKYALDQIIVQLEKNIPVIVLLKLSRSFYSPSANGVVNAAIGEQPEPERRHAVVAVGHGYFGDQRALLIRNSWGEQWGQSGFAWLTEQFLEPRLFGAAVLHRETNVPTNSVSA